MPHRFRPRLTFANVTSVSALFIALGGSAYAVTELPKNSVGTKQLKDSAVTTKKVTNGAVTGAKIKLSTLGTVPNASSANNARSLGGLRPSAFQQRVRWAIVKGDGTIAAQSGGITNSGHDLYLNPGSDLLNFGSSQAGKAIIATPNGDSNGEESASLCGGTSNPGGINCTGGSVPPGTNDTSHILVTSGQFDGFANNQTYYVAVIG